MVNTRSQINREIQNAQPVIDGFVNDDEDNISVVDHYSGTPRSYFNENDEETMRSQKRDHERLRIEQSFLEVNKQIGELTSMVKVLTEKVTNSAEENDQNVHNFGTSMRSDSCFVPHPDFFVSNSF